MHHADRWIAAFAALWAVLSPPAASAETYPSRLITIVVPFTPGSQTDTVARLIASDLQESLGQPVVIENKAGAGGLLAALSVARAPADGYTLLVTTNTTHSAAPGLFKSVPYDPIKDFTPVAQIGIFRSMVAVHTAQPIATIQDLVSYAKKNPGKLEYGHGNSTGQIMFETMKSRTGIDMVRIAYKSVPAMVTDLIAGHIAVGMPDFPTGMPQIKAGNIRPLAVMTKSRSRVLPDVPTLNETVMPGFDIHAWAGMFAPADLPADIRDTLARELARMLEKPDIKARFLAAGSEVQFTGPAEFQPFVRSELVKWTGLIKEAHIVPE